MGGSTSTPIASLAEMRTVPLTPCSLQAAMHFSAAALLCMASA
jgi:hypothetical protein